MEKILWPGWETVRVLGHGGFGAVYEIQRDVFGDTEKAALKVITIPRDRDEIDSMTAEGYDKESITQRFQEYMQDIVGEYKLMAKMKGNANIVYCDDLRYIQHDDGMGWDIYIKMELLTPVLKLPRAHFDETQVIRLGLDLCSVLIHCQAEHIIHRDIKPQNIFVSKDGRYKLGDFGIAKTADRTTSGTKTGTYKYMAPEVYNNRPYGSSVDIYSLGMVLYWLLNERRGPFLPLPPTVPSGSEEDLAQSRRFAGEALPAPAHGSEALKRIILKACAFDPQNRYATAAELKQDLENLTVAAGDPAKTHKARTASRNIAQTVSDHTQAAQGTKDDKTQAASVADDRTQAADTAFDDRTEAARTAGKDRTQRARGSEQSASDKTDYAKPARRRTADPVPEQGKGPDKRILILAIAGIAVAAMLLLGLFRGKDGETTETEGSSTTAGTTQSAEKEPEAAPGTSRPQAEAEAHVWVDATCTAPRTCTHCGLTEGEVLGHAWQPATYVAPQTCSRCGAQEGSAKSLAAGDILTLGLYEQDNDTANGREPIGWLVLEVEGTRALVISQACLDCLPYNNSDTPVTWESSTLRTWLNDSFYFAAFDETQRAGILLTTVKTPGNSGFGTQGGPDTNDYLFVLSRTEVEWYFPQDSANSQCPVTAYAMSKGAGTLGPSVYWWTRTPGSTQSTMLVADSQNSRVSTQGDRVACVDNTVRPAMWIDLTALEG